MQLINIILFDYHFIILYMHIGNIFYNVLYNSILSNLKEIFES